MGKTKIAFFLITIFLLNACNGGKNKIPYVYVDITLQLDNPEFSALSVPGGYVYITGGFSGIIVYREDRDVFKAYERACPYDPECGRVYLNGDSLVLTDSACCGSKFSLRYDGAVLKGPSEQPLRQYKTIYYPETNTLRITNQ